MHTNVDKVTSYFDLCVCAYRYIYCGVFYILLESVWHNCNRLLKVDLFSHILCMYEGVETRDHQIIKHEVWVKSLSR